MNEARKDRLDEFYSECENRFSHRRTDAGSAEYQKLFEYLCRGWSVYYSHAKCWKIDPPCEDFDTIDVPGEFVNSIAVEWTENGSLHPDWRDMLWRVLNKEERRRDGRY